VNQALFALVKLRELQRNRRTCPPEAASEPQASESLLSTLASTSRLRESP
jgi:hypothetical protein